MPKLTGITALPDDVSNSYQSNNTLPALRQDLRLFRGPLTADGSPSWTLYDPVRDSYYRIGWTEFEMLARWETGNITAFDIGETDEKNVWFGSGKSVGFHGGDIPGSDNVRVQ